MGTPVRISCTAISAVSDSWGFCGSSTEASGSALRVEAAIAGRWHIAAGDGSAMRADMVTEGGGPRVALNSAERSG